jgi:hypothetical protein
MSNAQTHTLNPNQANNQSNGHPTFLNQLDVTNILGYPRQIPPRYEKRLLKFIGNDVVSVEDHMSNF